MTRKEALAAIEQRLSETPSTRLGRLAKNPWKLVREHALRRLGLTLEVRSRTFWGGRFNGLLPEDVSSMVDRHGYFDLPVSRALLTYVEEGATVIDIGAHFGFFTLLSSWLAGPSGRIISVEAMPSTFDRLARNIAENSAHANVSIHRVAAYSEETELEFQDFGAVHSSLNSAFEARGTLAEQGARASKVLVPAVPMDLLLSAERIDRVDVVKIDAESSESFVLRGLSETVARHKPKLVVEVSDVRPAEQAQTRLILEWMQSQDYQPYRWKEGHLQPFPADGQIGYDNFVFIARGSKVRSDG